MTRPLCCVFFGLARDAGGVHRPPWEGKGSAHPIRVPSIRWQAALFMLTCGCTCRTTCYNDRYLNDAILPARFLQLDKMVQQSGGPFLCGKVMRTCDLMLYGMVSGMLDGSYCNGIQRSVRKIKQYLCVLGWLGLAHYCLWAPCVVHVNTACGRGCRGSI